MKQHHFKFTVEHMVGRREVELDVTYRVTPGRPETGPTYACGGTPAEPAEVEIVSVKSANGQPIVLSEAEEDVLLEMAIDRADEDLAEEAADYADYLYEQHRDRQMMERWERGK